MTEGRISAQKDIKKGIVKLLVFGPKRYDSNFALYFKDYLKNHYGIELIIWGCEYSNFERSYNNEMIGFIEKKYGSNFFDSIEKKVKNIYAKKTHLE